MLKVISFTCFKGKDMFKNRSTAIVLVTLVSTVSLTGIVWAAERTPASTQVSQQEVDQLRRQINNLQSRIVTLESKSTTATYSRNTLGQRIGQLENVVRITSNKVTLVSSGQLAISGSHVNVSSSRLDVNSGIVEISGTLKSDTLITNSVVSSNYTPGAGNVR